MRILLLFTLLLTACTQDEKTSKKLLYFDLLSVINKQIGLLNQEKPMFIKSYAIGVQKEIVQTTEIDWSKELALFQEVDINKQSYKNSYMVTQSDNGELIYSLKKEEELPVKWLKIKSNAKGIELEANVLVDNYLYTSGKEISLKIEGNKLQNYAIKGWQKLFIGNKKMYEIQGKLVQK